MDCIVLGPEQSKHGAVETREEAKRCAALFRENRDRIDGIIVTLPNFGDERAIADTLRLAELGVPVLIQATPDTAGKMTIARPPRQLLRQDVGLQQPAAVRHSVLADHAAHRESRLATSSPSDLQWFAAVCRVVNGLRNLRIGAHRRAAGGLQHRALQREDPRGARHLGRDRRPLRDPRPHRAA